ncbi:hypothetical protein DBZ36_07960 [Alginatibacterium sediminis]|uniref:DUF2066 domain-containing protein n=1 Tax=Alginatibacterium sediminis TaxID=2164068 RepID=A0A420EI92_9ALTE|nr:hypothetical protein [Alginatibacterium sediminis]RKF20364.1 hypothetical protein DBZ36_07960 [Alginatibacterium sediminis]
MKSLPLLLLTIIVSFNSFACALHDVAGFHFVTEPGSLVVFENVIAVRQSNALGNADKLDTIKLTSFAKAVSQTYPDKTRFIIFEPIKGHYNQLQLGRNRMVSEAYYSSSVNTVLLITEFDVLEALANNVLSWQQAKAQGLVTVNGAVNDTEAFDTWFTDIFSVSSV